MKSMMKEKSRRPFMPIGTAAVAVVAVAAASSPTSVVSSSSFPSSSTCTYSPSSYGSTVVHGIHRGGGNHDSEDPSSSSHIPPGQKDKKLPHTPAANKKKKTRPSKDDSAPSKQEEVAPTPIQSYISTEKDLYNILGLHQQPRSSISPTEIQKAYRRRCVLTHPDKVPNGDRAAFDKVTEAFTILSDENKRSIYDKFGIEALQDGEGFSRSTRMTPGGLGEEILRQFFGADGSFFHSSSSSRQQQNKPKNRNLRYQLEVSLEDMYNGSHQTVTIAQSSPGLHKAVEVTIPRGSAHGQTIHLPGEVDHIADSTPADVIFILVQRPHAVFTRKAHDLALEITLNLSEALCGFHRVITHLDGRKIHLTGPVLEGTSTPIIVQTGDVHVLKGEGMPKRSMIQNIGDPHVMDEQQRCQYYGDLYIQFKVELPAAKSGSAGGKKYHFEENLTLEERTTLRDLLQKLQGSKSGSQNVDTISLRSLKKASPSDFGRLSGSLESNENDDESVRDEEDSFRQGFQYFSSSGPGRSGFFSSSSASTDDNGNVQCQQM